MFFQMINFVKGCKWMNKWNLMNWYLQNIWDLDDFSVDKEVKTWQIFHILVSNFRVDELISETCWQMPDAYSEPCQTSKMERFVNS